MRSTTSQLKLCSEFPLSVVVPVVWHSFVPPRPLLTCRVIEASLAPLCPGSRNTVIPAIAADADADGAITVDKLSTTGAAAAYFSMSRRERQCAHKDDACCTAPPYERGTVNGPRTRRMPARRDHPVTGRLPRIKRVEQVC